MSRLPDGDAAVVDAGPGRVCSRIRSATIALVSNVDGGNDFIGDTASANVELVARLLTGDVDGDGERDLAPLERVRVLVTFNVPRAPAEPGDLGCGAVGQGGAWTSLALDRFCPDSPRAGSAVFDISPGDVFEDDLRCLVETRDLDMACVPETFDATLAALSPADAPVELAPLAGLGDGVNHAYLEREDVLVVLMHQSNRRDDCSRRVHVSPRSVGLCTDEGEDPYCCEDNLPPVSRTSEALREILRDRPVVYGVYGAFPSFDPGREARDRLDALLEDGISGDCVYVVPNPRSVRLARELHPNMHLLPLVCRGPEVDGERPPIDVTAMARDVFGLLCDR